MARLTTRLFQGALISGVAAALALACSASNDNSIIGGGHNSGGSGNGSSSGGSANGTGFGGSNSGGSGAGINLGGSSNSGGSGGNNIGDACAATHNDGKQVPLDMYIMMDKSGSMAGSSWSGVKSAITSFVNAGPQVAGIGVGIQFFPLGGPFGGGECNPQTYLPPAVTIQTLPGVAPQIISAMNGVSPNGGTPTVPAMQSAGQATTAYAKQHPDHKVIIVLATDGDPNDCNSTVGAVANVAQAAFTSTPSVMTFVIGIGNVSGLNQIAQAGGSGSTGAIIVSSATAGQDFLDAMNKIRGQALGCEYLLPKPSGGGTINPNQVNVVYTPKGGQGQLLYNVGGASNCTTKGGWYYDNQTKPTKIILCPASCNTVQGSGGSIDIQLGCATVPPPVQ